MSSSMNCSSAVGVAVERRVRDSSLSIGQTLFLFETTVWRAGAKARRRRETMMLVLNPLCPCSSARFTPREHYKWPTDERRLTQSRERGNRTQPCFWKLFEVEYGRLLRWASGPSALHTGQAMR